MLYEGGRGALPAAYRSRFESLGLELPKAILSTEKLMGSARHHPTIDLERLTGIRERRVCSDGEDSFTLAVAAARDCLQHSQYEGRDLDMVICCSITKYKGGLTHQFEPPLSLSIKEAIGASQAKNFDVSNACAGMMTGVFILNDFIRRGVIRRGMVVSGEYISHLGTNAAQQIRSILSPQLASLTLGDAGVAAIVDQVPRTAPGIELAAFTTLSEHSRLCVGMPATIGPGGKMYTRARRIHQVAIEDAPPLLAEALEQSGLDFSDIDYLIPHQTSARAIEKGAKEFEERLGGMPKHVVNNVAERGNTASTTHFVALYEYLQAGRFEPGDRILLLSFASGLEVGVVVFEVHEELVERYGRDH